MKYVAFLRGINIGKKQVKMDLLKKTLEELGFTNVKTFLASGNVVFETDESNQSTLRNQIEQALRKTFGFEIPVIIRTFAEIKNLVEENPFAKFKVDQNTKLYVTFLNEPPQQTSSAVKNNQFEIIQVDKELLSVVKLENNFGTVDFMSILEKQFGKNITTRNWNTIQKIAVL